VTFLKNGLMVQSVQSMRYAEDPSPPDESSRRPNHVPSLFHALWFSIGSWLPWNIAQRSSEVVASTEQIGEASNLPQKAHNSRYYLFDYCPSGR
jgi:hypothetical protein